MAGMYSGRWHMVLWLCHGRDTLRTMINVVMGKLLFHTFLPFFGTVRWLRKIHNLPRLLLLSQLSIQFYFATHSLFLATLTSMGIFFPNYPLFPREKIFPALALLIFQDCVSWCLGNSIPIGVALPITGYVCAKLTSWKKVIIKSLCIPCKGQWCPFQPNDARYKGLNTTRFQTKDGLEVEGRTMKWSPRACKSFGVGEILIPKHGLDGKQHPPSLLFATSLFYDNQ